MTTTAINGREEEVVRELFAICQKARAWYDSNAVYLYDTLPQSSRFLGMVNGAVDVLRPDSRFDWQNLTDLLDELRDRSLALLKPVREGV